MSSWLLSKSLDDQQKVMRKVCSLGPQLRRTHCQQQLIVWQEIAEELERKKQREEEDKARKAQKLQKQKTDIIQMVTEQGGPCQTAPNIISLLQRNKTKGLKMKAIKAQIDYHKVVLQVTSGKLKMTKLGLIDLAKNLICFLSGDDTAETASAYVQYILRLLVSPSEKKDGARLLMTPLPPNSQLTVTQKRWRTWTWSLLTLTVTVTLQQINKSGPGKTLPLDFNTRDKISQSSTTLNFTSARS